MKKKQKIQLLRISICAIMFILGTILRSHETTAFILLITAYLAAGYDTLLTAIRNIRYGNIFDENFLMTIATIGALCLKDYKEAVFVMLGLAFNSSSFTAFMSISIRYNQSCI